MIYAHPTSADPAALKAWAQRLIDDLNRFNKQIEDLPVFADDAAAAARVKVGEGYKTPDGLVRWRAS